MSGRPSVTVLIGAYDSAGSLSCAIESILSQSLSELELIVIDDGSSDDSAQVARRSLRGEPRARVLSMGANLGIPRSLNAGLREATAPVVAIQDADDCSAPQRLERQLTTLEAEPDVAVVGARMREVDQLGRSLEPRTAFAAGDVGDVLLRFNPIPNGVAALRLDAVLEVGGYDRRYRYAADYDLWLRLAERHRIVTLDEELGTRTMGATNVAAYAERAQTRESIAIRVAALRRRRTLRGGSALLRPVLSYLTPLPLKRALRRRRGQAP